MTTILTEFRQATRRSAGSPGYSLGVFLTLSPALYALGIGGGTACGTARVGHAGVVRGACTADGSVAVRMSTTS